MNETFVRQDTRARTYTHTHTQTHRSVRRGLSRLSEGSTEGHITRGRWATPPPSPASPGSVRPAQLEGADSARTPRAGWTPRAVICVLGAQNIAALNWYVTVVSRLSHISLRRLRPAGWTPRREPARAHSPPPPGGGSPPPRIAEGCLGPGRAGSGRAGRAVPATAVWLRIMETMMRRTPVAMLKMSTPLCAGEKERGGERGVGERSGGVGKER